LFTFSLEKRSQKVPRKRKKKEYFKTF